MSWQQLAAIYAADSEERRAAEATPPSACPDCGEPLEAGPRGELHCPWDGFVWAS